MCISPVVIPSRKRTLSAGSRLYMAVPCGNCSECNNAAVSQLHVRAYHEYLDCLVVNNFSNTFLWYDTLTYRDADLPHINDFIEDVSKQFDDNFSCFNNVHLTLTLKRLRQSLARRYSGAKLRFFIVPEYGNDDRYTHRPHWHVMFFCYNIPEPSVFGELLAKAWHYGYTEYSNPSVHKPIDHFCITSRMNAQRAVGYISKYCSKVYSFLDVVKERLQVVKEVDESLYRKVLPRRRLSIGFGLSALIWRADSVLNSDSLVYVEDARPVVYKLDSYFIRSLYKYLTSDEFGCKRWEYKISAFDFIKRRNESSVESRIDFYNKYFQFFDDSERFMFYTKMDGRTLNQLAIYDVYFRYRIYFNCNPSDYVINVQLSEFCRASNFHNYTSGFMGEERQVYIYTDFIMSSGSAYYCSDYFKTEVDIKAIPVYDERTFPEFANFDFVLDMFYTKKKVVDKFKSKSDAIKASNINIIKSLKF